MTKIFHGDIAYFGTRRYIWDAENNKVDKMKTLVTVAALTILIAIVGCSSKPGHEELFQQAEAFQKAQEFEKAAETYSKIVEAFPEGEKSDEALFMVGFIYANELNDTTKARSAYKSFLDKYSATADSGMVQSALFEMQYLGKEINEIDQLQDVIKTSDTEAATKAEALETH